VPYHVHPLALPCPTSCPTSLYPRPALCPTMSLPCPTLVQPLVLPCPTSGPTVSNNLFCHVQLHYTHGPACVPPSCPTLSYPLVLPMSYLLSFLGRLLQHTPPTWLPVDGRHPIPRALWARAHHAPCLRLRLGWAGADAAVGPLVALLGALAPGHMGAGPHRCRPTQVPGSGCLLVVLVVLLSGGGHDCHTQRGREAFTQTCNIKHQGTSCYHVPVNK